MSEVAQNTPSVHTHELRLWVHFNTPAFLGGADQSSEWRTPPFKNLLREWWRVVKAAELGWKGQGARPLWETIREAEGRLFGHAHLKHKDRHGRERTWQMQSRLSIALDRWREGSLKTWPDEPEIPHRWVQRNGGMTGAHLYLGYGPIPSRGKLKAPPAIGAGECSRLTISLDGGERELEDLRHALALAHWFGSVGGRRSNGWGSLSLHEGTGRPICSLEDTKFFQPFARPLADCLKREWPSALGTDDGDKPRPLIWRTRKEHTSWSNLQVAMAKIKIAMRINIGAPPYGSFGDLHLLGLPVGNHKLGFKSERLASQLRIKIHTVEGGQLVALIVHLPHRLPNDMANELDSRRDSYHGQLRNQEVKVWKKVHDYLDNCDDLGRVGW